MSSLQELITIKADVVHLSQIMDDITKIVLPPIFYDSGISHTGFRYMQPGALNFCIIKGVKAISGLNASIALAEKGYIHEVCVLMRTIIEACSYIDFMLTGFTENKVGSKQQKILDNFFADFKRNSPEDFGGSTIRQEDVHKTVANDMQQRFSEEGCSKEYINFPMAKMMSNIYSSYSNYVHGRYPEVMDLYGGEPPYFHMEGMAKTPKDIESVKIIETFFLTVKLAIRLIVATFQLEEKLDASQINWLKK